MKQSYTGELNAVKIVNLMDAMSNYTEQIIIVGDLFFSKVAVFLSRLKIIKPSPSRAM